MVDFNSIESVSAEVLKRVPQQDPFRFIDDILEIDENHCVATYTYKKDEYFYKGHFPGKPMTPGVIMIETMAQTGVVALGIYLLLKEEAANPDKAGGGEILTVFTDVEAEFTAPIDPGEKVIVKAEKLFWRRRKLRAKVEIIKENGDVAASATLSGFGVPKNG